MPFDPRTFLDIAKELQQGSSQAHFRSLINRTYYAVFGYVRNELRIFSERKNVHHEVYETLLRSVSINKKIAGKKLEVLFTKRKEADYNHRVSFPSSSKEHWFKEAQEIIRLFNAQDDDDDNE